MRILLSLLIFISFIQAETRFADPEPSIIEPRQIVFSVTEDSSHAIDHILSVANNVLKFYGPENVEMEIVAYSKGIRLLLNRDHSTMIRVDALMQYGVTFIACGNTMKTKNIRKDQLIKGSEIVTAGVVELLERVQEGWLYIKP